MPIQRSEVWMADLGSAAKYRPCLVLSVSPAAQDRDLVTLVPHTTSVQGTRIEVDVPKTFLKTGVFDAQALVTVAPSRMRRKLGDVLPADLAMIEDAVKRWLGM